jgi:hypothetical protein
MNNLGSLLAGGPALLRFRGGVIYSKDGFTLSPELGSFKVSTDIEGEVDERDSQAVLSIAGTPSGVLADRSAFFRFLAQRPGDFVVPVMAITAIALDTNILTVPRHVWETGDPVYVSGDGNYTLPAAVAAGTLYYVKKLSATTLTLHDTAAHATAGTNAIDFADDGDGNLCLVDESPAVLETSRNKKITFWNAAVTTPPPLDLAAQKTAFGGFQIQVWRRHGKAWADEESLFKVETQAWTDPAFNPADIVTQPYAVSWGAVAPWAGISTEAGVSVQWSLGTTEKGNDAEGTVNRQIDNIGASASFVPIGVTEEDLLNAMNLQGAGHARGQSRASGAPNLDIAGTGLHVRLYAAVLVEAPSRFNRKDYRAGTVKLNASASYTGGVRNPIAYVGANAPA